MVQQGTRHLSTAERSPQAIYPTYVKLNSEKTSAKGLLPKIENNLAAVLVRCRSSAVVPGCPDMPSGSNLGQIEISVRGVAAGCVAGSCDAAGEFFRSVANPVLAAA